MSYLLPKQIVYLDMPVIIREFSQLLHLLHKDIHTLKKEPLFDTKF